MKNLAITFLVFLSCITLHAQQPQEGIVQGVVNDSQGRGLSLVTISLLHLKDSSLVKVELSGENGSFALKAISPGSFFLQYAIIGFKTISSSSFKLRPGQTYNAGVMNLSAAIGQLQELKVTAKKPLVQVKPDRTVFNVQNSINATGSNALELLQKSPGVTVDNNENILVKGKAGVRVYVDGRMLQLAGEELAAYLKSMTSQDIEAIEMITNPGARYDASGNAGVINIRLRKNISMGANGNITAGLIQGITPKVNGSVNVNYRNKKINLYSNAGVNIGRYQTDILAPRSQKDTLYDQQLWQLSYSKNFNGKTGIDYFINTRQTIGVMATFNYNDEDWKSRGNTNIYYQPSDDYIKRLSASNTIPRKRTSLNTNLNYRIADTTGREFNVDVDYGIYRGRARSYQPNYYIDNDDNLLSAIITRNSTPTNIDIYTSRAEVILPWQKSKLSIGAKFSYVKTDNTLDFFIDENGNSDWIADRSYNFSYRENINAAFLTYERRLGSKWKLLGGIRMEQTYSKGILTRGDGLLQADNTVKRNYVDWFPNAVVTWTVAPTNVFTLSYTRRIDRPNYQSLNPFELRLDELSYVKGNSFLRPQYTDNIELAHTWKNTITTTAGYSHVKDLATQTVDTLNNYTYALAKNLATQKIVSFSISTPVTINNWWSGFVNLWLNHQEFDGKVNKNEVSLKSWAYGLFIQQSFLLGHDYSAEISSWLNGPSPLGPTLEAKSMGGVDIGLQKLLLQKKATLKIAVTDIFHTAVPFRGKTDFGGLLLKFWVTRETQTARIHFTYRFGNSKIKAARQRLSGLEAEVQRIKESQ